MIRTSEEQKLTRSVFASLPVLRQYPGPSTSRRYAEVPNIGIFEWSLGSVVADDGATAIVPSGGGAIGTWILTQPSSNYSTSVWLVATSALTLSGVQDVGGTDSVTGRRILATEQPNPVDNGIYVANDTGAWARSSDMANGKSVALGLSVVALAGEEAGGLWYMSSPTSGSAVVGATALTFGQLSSANGGGLPQSGTWDGAPLTIADNRYYTATANGDNRIVLAINPTGHVVGAQALIYIAPNELSSSADLIIAADLNIANTASFDPTLATWITITRLANGFVGSLDVRPAPDVALPTIVSATVENSTPTKLDVVYAERTIVRTPAGLTLDSPARTLTQDNGQGTTTHRYTISGGAFVGGEAGNFLAAAGALQDMNGNLCGALSQAYVNNTGVYVMPRAIGRWKGSSVVQSGTITSWTDLSGNGNTLTQSTGGSRATYVASDASINNKPCGDFDGIDDFYENLDLKIAGVDPTDLNDYTILAVCKFDATSGHALFSAFPDSAGVWSGINVFAEINSFKVTAIDSGNATLPAFTTTTWVKVRVEVTNALRRIWVNGVLLTDLGTGFDNADDTPPLTACRLGRLPTSLYHFNGRSAELGHCSGTMSAPEVTAWDAYVASEYGL